MSWNSRVGVGYQLSDKLLERNNSYNPQEDEQEYYGTQTLDNIEAAVVSLTRGLQRQSQEGSWLDRNTGIGDDILRLLGGGLMNTAQAISIIPGVKQIGELEDWIAARARDTSLALNPNLDPRFAGWGTRILTNWVADKGISKVGKVAKAKLLKQFEGYQGLIGGVGTAMDTGGVSRRFTWKDIPGRLLWKGGQPDTKVISKVDALLGMMDDWRLSHLDLDKPMTGFVKHYGRKPTFWQDGKEYVIGWSRKKGTYEIDDLQKRINRRARRLAGDKTSSDYDRRFRQIKEAIVRDLNKQADELPVEQWDIMIQNPGDAYKEHLISVDSPFWKSQRGKNAGYLAGDSKNLKVLTDQNFKTLKDNVEKHVHSQHKNLYVDYDPISHNLVLKDLQTGKALKTQIPGIGDPSQAKEYVKDVIEGRPMRDIVDINPKTPSNIQRQIQKAYFADVDDITANAIIDRIRGKSWNKIRQEYGKDFTTRQLNIAEDKLKQLSKSEVMAIINAYKIGGKGRTRY